MDIDGRTVRIALQRDFEAPAKGTLPLVTAAATAAAFPAHENVEIAEFPRRGVSVQQLADYRPTQRDRRNTSPNKDVQDTDQTGR